MKVLHQLDNPPFLAGSCFMQYIDIQHIHECVDKKHHHIVDLMLPHLNDGYRYTTFTYKSYVVFKNQPTCRRPIFHYDCVMDNYPEREENNILYTSCFGTLFGDVKAPENSIIQYGRELHSGYKPEIQDDVYRVMLRISQSDVIHVNVGGVVTDINKRIHRQLNKGIDKKYLSNFK